MQKAYTRHVVQCYLQRAAILFVVILCYGAVSLAGSPAWLTMETDHFFIHFVQGREDFAHSIAQRAEAVHERLVPMVGHAPDDKTHIVIRDGEDTANALASPLYENRIEINSTFPTVPEAYLSGFGFGHDDWFTTLLLHEYTHILQLDMKPASAQSILNAFGRIPLIVSPMLISPPFVLEGYAVYMESVLGGGRGGSTYYDMFLRTAALHHAIPEYDQVLGEYALGRWQPGGHIYLFGYSFLQYVADEFGEDSLRAMNEQLQQRPTSLDHAMSAATGVSLPALWERWQRAVLDQANAQVQSIQHMPLTTGDTVHTVGQHAMMPAVSPEGDRIAFIATGGVAPSLRLLHVHTGEEQHVASLQAVLTSRIAWHPAGEHVVVAVLTPQGDGTVQNRLALVHVDTGEIQYVSAAQRGYSPSYDREGRRLAFIVKRNEGSELQVCSGDCETTQSLFYDPEKTLLSAVWSPTADQLALTVWEEAHGAYVALYDAETHEFRPIVGGSGDFLMPSWARDGRRLVLAGDRSGIFNVYTYDLADKSLTRVTNTTSGLFSPVFASNTDLLLMQYSADGYELAYVTPDDSIRVDEPAWVEASEADDAGNITPFGTPFGTYSISDYVPWHTLRPTFWLPSVRERAGEAHVGAMTAGEDILGAVRYTVEASVGVGTGRTMYDVALEHDIWNGAWTVLAHLQKTATLRENKPNIWDDVIEVSGGVRWVGALPAGAQMAWLQGVQQTVQANNEAAFVPKTNINRVEAGWRAEQNSGQLATRVRRYYEAVASSPLQRTDGWLVTLVHDNTYRNEHGGYVRWRVDAGVGGEGEAFALRSQQFSLRGIPRRENELFGQVVLRTTIEGRLRVVGIKRGYADTPLFFNELALYPFVQTRYTTDIKDTAANDVTFAYGAELGLDMYMAYGTLRNDWRVGIAKKQGAQSPEIYVRVASSF